MEYMPRSHKTIMKPKTLVIAPLMSLTLIVGCAVTPQIDENGVKQIFASTPKAEGEIKFFSIAQWLPNSREFNFSPEKQTPRIAGVAIVTEKSILFQQWGGPTGLNIIKKIDFNDVEEVKLISFGRSSRIVVRSKENQFDSFAASEITGEVSIAAGTQEMHAAIVKLIKR